MVFQLPTKAKQVDEVIAIRLSELLDPNPEVCLRARG